MLYSVQNKNRLWRPTCAHGRGFVLRYGAHVLVGWEARFTSSDCHRQKLVTTKASSYSEQSIAKPLFEAIYYMAKLALSSKPV